MGVGGTTGNRSRCEWLQSETWLWRERERVLGDRSEVEEQRDQLERDRLLLVEAAKKLDREVGRPGTEL